MLFRSEQADQDGIGGVQVGGFQFTPDLIMAVVRGQTTVTFGLAAHEADILFMGEGGWYHLGLLFTWSEPGECPAYDTTLSLGGKC